MTPGRHAAALPGRACLGAVDIGGSGVSGFAPAARTMYEEALRFPPTKIIEGGALQSTWERFIAANVRAPEAVINDIRSMIAANNVAALSNIRVRVASACCCRKSDRYERGADDDIDLGDTVMNTTRP